MRLLYEELGGRAPAIEVLSVEGIEQAVSLTTTNLDDLTRNMLDVKSNWLEHDDGPHAWLHRVLEFAEKCRE
jgi:hypothetical protein